MAAHSSYAVERLEPVLIGRFSRLRVLAWSGEWLYASRGYTVLRAKVSEVIEWERVGSFGPAAWRVISSSSRLASRFFRDGFHALAVLPSGHLIGAVPGAVVTLSPGETEFRMSHRVVRGLRPLHIAATPGGHVFWGEYFDNSRRDEVHIYGSIDGGAHWEVAYTFPRGAIRHVHNVVYDEWENCFWVLTGDLGAECRIIRASCDFRTVDVVLSGNQQTRCAVLVPTHDAVYFSSDTPFEVNHVYCLDRRSGVARAITELNGSSIYGCLAGDAVFFSTMVEPSATNLSGYVLLYGSGDGVEWHCLRQWKKDRWPMGLFQYGNAFLPDGKNTSGVLAATTIAVEHSDMEACIWRV
ncbi:MAG TPA: hypothetical protein VGP35_04770 [Terriglobales bacterium]|jgi:hypothetical protein|nr:hypothetical protein [Terriglobales bacterium]